jgi:ferredoxin, 2Fe-2S
MVEINVTDSKGQKHLLAAAAGGALMELLRDQNMGVDAICGGCCSCATCHVFIGQKWAAKMPPRSEEENDLLLATASYRSNESRLSCQIVLTDQLDGLEVTVPAPD